MTGSSITRKEQTMRRYPAAWVPTLYFAEGLPFYAVNYMALFFYQDMGLKNAVTTLVISLLAWPWTLKPIWSPMLEMYKTKKFFVVLMELVGGLSLVLIALSLNMPGYFRYSVAIFAVLGFCSATHDIAADGIYIAALSSKEQAAYVGWQGGFYNLARIFSVGGLLWLVGVLGETFARAHASAPVVHAWMVVFGALGLMLVALSLYHVRMLPTGGEERKSESVRQMAATFADVVVSFFKKPHIFLLLIFIFLYRAGEGQVIKVGPLFLRALRTSGGLGLSSKEVGAIYGVFGSGAFILGSILGGYFIAHLGLKRALPWLVLILNLPMIAYWYLSVALPTNPILVTTAMSAEMFGYGFGFVGVILLMMQEIAPGKYQTAHYAFANALMNIGVILPGAVSGWIQTRLGYTHFFIWVIIAALPALVLSRFIPMRGGVQAIPPRIAKAQG
ncbi:MAG: MFS transporter [Terracidiphilus sp.]|jgi:PAT family beta-lactamase induction signal transducer AmpG